MLIRSDNRDRRGGKYGGVIPSPLRTPSCQVDHTPKWQYREWDICPPSGGCFFSVFVMVSDFAAV